MHQEYKILIVDNDTKSLRASDEFLSSQGFLVFSAFREDEAFQKIEEIMPDLIILNAALPNVKTIDICRRLKENRHSRNIPIIMIIDPEDKENRAKGFTAEVDCFLKLPFLQEELLAAARSLSKIRYLVEEEKNIEAVFYELIKIVDAKDFYTSGHSERVVKLSSALVKELNLAQERLAILEKAAKVYDIGKIAIPEMILNKPVALTEKEYNQIKTHAVLGEKICSPLRSFQPVLSIIRHHHERWDGKGYPDGIEGNNIPLEARIIAVVDSFDAMATDRPYRSRLPKERIIAIFNAGAGTQWDEKIVKVFVKMIEENTLNIAMLYGID